MIIYYQKSDGRIIGTTDGRVHSDDHLKMWIGDRNETDRAVYQWKKNEENIFEPDVSNQEQKNILMDLDNRSLSVYDLYIDTVSGNLVKKSKDNVQKDPVKKTKKVVVKP